MRLSYTLNLSGFRGRVGSGTARNPHDGAPLIEREIDGDRFWQCDEIRNKRRERRRCGRRGAVGGAGRDQWNSHLGVRRREGSGGEMTGLAMVLLLVVVALAGTALTLFA
ncbi:hypothetical protein GCM10027271_30740 [Saccharopolyspora gloriosae]